jgi:hypothetical protein
MGNCSQFIHGGFSIYKVGNISGGNNSDTVFYGLIDTPNQLASYQPYGNVAGNRSFNGFVNGVLELEADEAVFIKCFIFTPENTQFPISNFSFTSVNVHKLEVFEQTVFSPSLVKSGRIHEVLNKQLEIILDKVAPLKSDFFGTEDLGYDEDGPACDHFIIPGLMLRGFEGKPFNLSTKDWFTSLDGIFCLAMSCERDEDDNEFVRLEPMEYFFRNTLLMKLTVISKYHRKPATDLLFNELEFGFKKYPQDGQADSLEDFHTKKVFGVTPLTRIKHALKVTIDWILSGYYIEYTRREGFAVRPKDTYETDADTFLVSGKAANAYGDLELEFNADDNYIDVIGEIVALVEGDTFQIVLGTGGVINGTYVVASIDIPYAYDRTRIYTISDIPTTGSGTGTLNVIESERYQAKRDEDFDQVQNVAFVKSVYNLEHHIKRIFLRWAKYFQSGWSMYIRDEEEANVRFTSGANNDSVNTTLKSTATLYGDNPRQKRYDDIGEGRTTMEKPLFAKDLIEFEAPLTWTAFNYLRYAFEGRSPDGRDYGYLSWISPRGKIEKGFIQSMKFSPTKQTCKFTVIEKYEDA